MKLLPYESFYIFSSLQPKEIQAKLAEVVSPWSGYNIRLFKGPNPAGPYTTFKGYVLDDTFKFKPLIIYQNAFLPQISGTIKDQNGGSIVHVKMTLNTIMLIITIIILTTAGVFCIYFFPELISKHHRENDVIPYLLFLFLYCIALGAFKMESITSRRYLIELLSS